MYLCSVVLFGYCFYEKILNQSNPFCTYIISSNQITRAHSDDTIINNGHFSHRKNCVAYVSDMMSSELWCNFTPISLLFKSYFCDWFPQLPVQPRTECTRTDTLNSDPIIFFYETCHSTQPWTDHHSFIDHHSHRGQPLPQHFAKNNIYVALVLILRQLRAQKKCKNAASSKTQNLTEVNCESSLLLGWRAINMKKPQD